MQIYPLDAVGVWLGVAIEARPDPLTKGVFLVPANCAPSAPPQIGPNQAAQYINGAWQIVPDFRGATYWLADRSKASITDVGVSLPIEYLSADPGPSLADLRVDQLNKISAACAAAIMAGFTSSALGAEYTYPCATTDQINLNGSVTDSYRPGIPSSWSTPFVCMDSAGVWGARAHTAAQIQQAGSDCKAHVLTQLGKKWAYGAAINAAMTPADVQAVVWE